MKTDKPSLKKAVKAVTKSIRDRSAALAARIRPARKAAVTKIAAKASAKPSAAAVAPAPKSPAAKTKSKSAPKVATPELPPVPPILLEGDHSPAITGGPGQRYALGPVPPVAHLDSREELPESYGTKRLLLTARDPHWLYARWDFSREQQRKYNKLSVDRHLVVRLYLNEVKSQPFDQIHVHPESTHWFIPVAQAGAKYLAEIGYYLAAGKWVSISVSDATLTPPDAMSEDFSAEFATIPTDIPFRQLMELAQTAVKDNIPLVEILQQLRASGFFFPKARVGEKWTPEKQRALAAIITMDSVRRVWMGSIEITELIRRQLRQDMSSMGVSQLSLPSSPFGGISSFSSLSSPFGSRGESEKGRSFWFNVNAELILYGATEPDAEVTIGGRVIKLRPDGTFSYRFSLPDGKYDLPAVAVSYDKSDSRSADLKFSRSTDYRGDVGVHPQDARLKPPLVANVA